MKTLYVEFLMGHNTGLKESYNRAQQGELLEEYLKAVPDLSIFVAHTTSTAQEEKVFSIEQRLEAMEEKARASEEKAAKTIENLKELINLSLHTLPKAQRAEFQERLSRNSSS